MECVQARLIIIMCGAAKQQPAGEMNGSWELDFYRKYNEQAELQLAGQGDTISKPRATQRRVIGQIISLISLQLTLSPAQ